MGYSFMHIGKINSYYKMGKAYEHNYRTTHVSNAIPELKDKNEELVHLHYKNGKQMTYQEAWAERLHSLPAYSDGTHKIRSNAILALDIVITFSREDRERIDLEQWKKENINWLQKNFNAAPEKYGDNVLSVMYHGDEVGNVHCHAFIQPIDDKGHLNASFYTDGRENGKSRYALLQDSYAEQMKQFGLQRGLEGSKARHKDIKKFYAELNQAIGSVPKPRKGELATDYYERFQESMETLAASYMKKGLERERSAEEWITEKTNDFKQKMLEEREKLKQEQEQCQREIEQKLSACSLTIAEKEQRSSDMDCLIQDKTRMYNAMIDQKQQELAELNNRMIDVQDIVMGYENEYVSMKASDFLSHLQEGSPIYTTLQAIDAEGADLINRIVQERFLDILQEQDQEH